MIAFKKVSKRYGEFPFLLENIDLKIERGSFFYLTGISGAGKTTVFKLLLGQELPTKGQVLFDGDDITMYRPRTKARHRRRVGMVYQDVDNYLLRSESIERNVIIPLEIAGQYNRQGKQRVAVLLEKIGLYARRKEPVSTLSGGEKQLVSIARAMVFEPDTFFADEPTGNLDPKASIKVLNLLKDIHQLGTTVLVATHDISFIRKYSARTLLISNKNIRETRIKKDKEKDKYKDKDGRTHQ